MENNNLGRGFEWDDVIQNDSPEFVTLPEGDYVFEVLKLEKARHNGSAKLPPCNKAILTMAIEGEQGRSVFKHNLFLHSATEGLLCAFFSAIGQRKHGEPLQMNWQAVVGAKGRAKVGVRSWVSDRGNDCTANEIKQFYDYDLQAMPKEPWMAQPQVAQPQVTQTTYQQPVQQTMQAPVQQGFANANSGQAWKPAPTMDGAKVNGSYMQNPMPANGFSMKKEDDPF